MQCKNVFYFTNKRFLEHNIHHVVVVVVVVIVYICSVSIPARRTPLRIPPAEQWF